jgi:hypothetical protein
MILTAALAASNALMAGGASGTNSVVTNADGSVTIIMKTSGTYGFSIDFRQWIIPSIVVSIIIGLAILFRKKRF